MNTMDRVIDWCQDRGFGVDANFAKGTIVISSSKKNAHKFANAEAAMKWATDFSKNWGFQAP